MDQRQYPQYEHAIEMSNKKVMQAAEHTQALAMIAIAEAIHRLAKALEERPVS